MLQISKYLMIVIMLVCSSISSARYLQSDSLDILGNSNDPAKLVAFQQRNTSYQNYYSVQVPYRPVVRMPQPTVQLNHMYGYANQNPVMNIDPTGEFAIVIPFIPAIITGTDLAAGAMIAAILTIPGDSSSATDDTGENCPTDDECYERCKHLLPSPSGDLQSSEYRKCWRECKGTL